MVAESQHYEKLERILQEAGFLFTVRDEQCEVVGDRITVANPTLIAKKCEGDQIEATVEDVTVLNDGRETKVKEVDAEQGVIVLEQPLESNKTVSVFYRYSMIELDYLKVVRDDVEELIRAKLRNLNQCAKFKTTEVINKLRIITRLWSGGLLLSREYGYNTDSEQTSRDGYRKIQEAKTLLNELYEELFLECGQDDVNGGSGNVISGSSGSLFNEAFKTPRNISEW